MTIPTDDQGTRQIDDVYAFWFGEPTRDPGKFRRKLERWYRGGETIDAEIRRRFGTLVEQALRGELDRWKTTQRGRIALILDVAAVTREAMKRQTARQVQAEREATS